MSDAKRTQTSANPETRRRKADAGKDPYSFKSGEVTVRMKFSGGRSIEETVSHYLAMRDNADSVMGAK